MISEWELYFCWKSETQEQQTVKYVTTIIVLMEVVDEHKDTTWELIAFS